MSEAVADASQDLPAAPKSKMVPMMLVLNTLLVAGVLVFTLTRKQAPAAAPAPAPAATGEPAGAAAGKGPGPGEGVGGMGPTVHLENFIVQLKAVDAERFAHLGIDLEVGGEDDKGRIAAQLPRIRDAVIMYLADRTADELRGSEGMGRVKEALLERMRKMVPTARIAAVLITDFIVQ